MATIEVLRSIELFKNLNDSDLQEILPFCKERTFDDGVKIYTQGTQGKEFFLLLDGNVKLQIPTDKGYGLTVIFVEKGDTFGISGLLEPQTYTSTAICSKEAKVIIIETEPFIDLIANKNIKLGFVIMKNLAQIFMKRLDATRQQLRNLVSQVEITIP